VNDHARMASPAVTTIYGEPPKVANPSKLVARGLDFYYNDYHALRDIHLPVAEKQVTALIGNAPNLSPPQQHSL